MTRGGQQEVQHHFVVDTRHDVAYQRS